MSGHYSLTCVLSVSFGIQVNFSYKINYFLTFVDVQEIALKTSNLVRTVRAIP